MTREEIREKAQVLLDEYADSGGWSDDELNHIIDLACNEVASLFLEIDESRYISSTTFSLTPSTEQYDLPTGCLRIKRITDADNVPLTRLYDLAKRNEYIGYGVVKLYYLQSDKVGFLDIPSASASFPCLYIRQPIALVDDDSIPDVPEYLGHDLIVIETAVIALALDEEQNRTLNSKAENLRNQIREVYYTRNTDFPRQAPRDEALDDLD